MNFGKLIAGRPGMAQNLASMGRGGNVWSNVLRGMAPPHSQMGQQAQIAPPQGQPQMPPQGRLNGGNMWATLAGAVMRQQGRPLMLREMGQQQPNAQQPTTGPMDPRLIHRGWLGR